MNTLTTLRAEASRRLALELHQRRERQRAREIRREIYA